MSKDLVTQQKGVARRGVFGELIRQLRRNKGWSQDRLARELKMSKGRVNDIEKLEEPRVHISTLAKLAEKFGYSVQSLEGLFREAKAGRPFQAPTVSEEDALVVPLESGDYERLKAVADRDGMTVDEVAEEFILEGAEYRERERAKKRGWVITLTDPDTGESETIPADVTSALNKAAKDAGLSLADYVVGMLRAQGLSTDEGAPLIDEKSLIEGLSAGVKHGAETERSLPETPKTTPSPAAGAGADRPTLPLGGEQKRRRRQANK